MLDNVKKIHKRALQLILVLSILDEIFISITLQNFNMEKITRNEGKCSSKVLIILNIKQQLYILYKNEKEKN